MFEQLRRIAPWSMIIQVRGSRPERSSRGYRIQSDLGALEERSLLSVRGVLVPPIQGLGGATPTGQYLALSQQSARESLHREAGATESATDRRAGSAARGAAAKREGINHMVDGIYRDLLGRDARPGELEAARRAVLNGRGPQYLAQVVSSAEFRRHYRGDTAQILQSVSTLQGNRAMPADFAQSLASRIDQAGSPAARKQALTQTVNELLNRSISMMFVQTASGGKLSWRPGEGYLLTLTGVSPQTTEFADRPVRFASTVDTAGFAADFATTFGVVPPNAVLVLGGGSTPAEVVPVMIRQPSYDASTRTLTYRVNALNPGQNLASFLPAAADGQEAANLFIDAGFGPERDGYVSSVQQPSHVVSTQKEEVQWGTLGWVQANKINRAYTLTRIKHDYTTKNSTKLTTHTSKQLYSGTVLTYNGMVNPLQQAQFNPGPIIHTGT